LPRDAQHNEPSEDTPRRELDQGARIAIVREHFDYVWRLLRRLGLPPADADDAAQDVFLVGLQRYEQIQSGRERAFLYGCALNKAAQFRKRRAAAVAAPEVEQGDAEALSPEALLDRKRAQNALDALLNVLPEEQRSVFVLFEIEQLSTLEIATLLGIAQGTVGSRLRLARARIQAEAARLQQELGVTPTPQLATAGALLCTIPHD
jgi:RNA polymerase sigma-70 factor (ECF subfamily)